MLPRLTSPRLLAVAMLCGTVAAAGAQQPGERYDLLIAGGSVVDGTGAPGRVLDVGIRGDRIVALAPALDRAAAARVLDATGRTVAPGFIDFHAHLEPLLELPLAESALRQGVTLAVGGQDGSSRLPLAPYLDSVRVAGPGINVAFFAGHNDVRRAVLGLAARAPSAAELAQMTSLVRQAMHDGAFGLSSGLSYLPGTYAAGDELVALARAAADSGGLYSTHLRDEGSGLIAAVAEALEIGRRAHVPVVLAHHKAMGEAMWGKTAVTLAIVDSARRAGTDVMLDQYPYTATQTGIDMLVPAWALAGGRDEFRKRLAQPALADSILGGMVGNLLEERGGGDLDRIQFSRVSWDTGLEGKTLTQLAECRNLEPTPENGARVVLDAVLSGGGSAIYHVLAEADVRRVMAHPFTMIASDGRLSRPGEGQPHPRSYGTFPRVLGEYVRAQRVLSLEAAVRKMTGLPAARLGLADRGLLKPGAYADVVIFDPATVRDVATFADPHRYPAGIETVIVNGAVSVEHGQPTGERAGRVLTRPRD